MQKYFTHSRALNQKILSNGGIFIGGAVAIIMFLVVYTLSSTPLFVLRYQSGEMAAAAAVLATTTPTVLPLDIAAYNAKLQQLANYKISTSTGTLTATSTIQKRLWPVKTVYPNAGALLPFNRIVAYYGNFYSKGMGVLGEYPEDVVITKLQAEVAKWNAADPTTPVIPAIHYIVVTAQGSPGKDGKYRLRMPDSQVDKALALARKMHGILFLDVQVALSNLPAELPLYKDYFAQPDVHLGIDPEFAMHNGVKPGRVIGTMDATDVNFAAQYLATLVKENNLPPKILIVHRFTEEMLTHYKQITPLPEVQIVVDMDGWGYGAKKINTYTRVVTNEPVQFTGFKLFYKNDLRAPSRALLTPKELLILQPQPSYIQYQ